MWTDKHSDSSNNLGHLQFSRWQWSLMEFWVHRTIVLSVVINPDALFCAQECYCLWLGLGGHKIGYKMSFGKMLLHSVIFFPAWKGRILIRSKGSNQSRKIYICPGFDFTQVIISLHLEKGKHYVDFRSLNLFKSQL